MDELRGTGIELRRAGDGDDDLIRRILALAVGWRDAPPQHLPADLGQYHEGWPRPDDIGVVAFRGIEFVGGAYARRVGPADGTYGYLDGHHHELTIGVEASHRSQGIGRLLLETIKARTIERGIGGISLSVEPDNPARRLYEAAGFSEVAQRQTDVLMAWTNPARWSPDHG